MSRTSLLALGASAAILLLASATPASAVLTLTAAGTGAGFTLTTFVSGYDFGGNYGPIAQGISSTGHVITGSVGDQKIYVFNDVDNQVLGNAVASHSYVCQTSNCNYAMATAGGKVYGAQAFGGTYEVFADDGTSTVITSLRDAGLRGNLGMWGDPNTGHIFAASNFGLVNIDPVAGAFTVVNANLFPDGVSVSPDSSTLFVENGGTIQSYNASTGAFIHTFATGHNPDGTGVILGGVHNGKVVVNNNDGTVGLLNPALLDGDPNQFIIIATGGTRGDFVSADRSNGTLFIAEVTDVHRLSCGQGCSIGGPSDGIPEPTAWALLIMGFGATGAMLRRRRTPTLGLAAA
ncbi:MAG: proteinsorting protein [Phenylobacterium sp.]|nr:proteinsorting protein [Phenylobacterium sp.]